MVHNGWDDIGYHFGVVLTKGSYEVMVGRPLNKNGAHTKGYNNVAVGFCFVGNFEIAAPAPAALEAAAPVLGWLVDHYQIPPHQFIGHNAVSATACPGRYFPLPRLRSMIYG